MKRILLIVVTVCMVVFVSQAARQNPTDGQRVHFKIGIPPGQQPKLLLPDSNTIELSALSMERDEASVMHLKGAAEIRFALSPSRVAVIRSDEATYNLNTAEIQIPSELRMTEERAQ